MNFLTYPPTSRQFDGEYDSLVVVCACVWLRVREKQTETEAETQNKGEEEEKGEAAGRGDRMEGRQEQSWGERASTQQLTKQLIFSHFYTTLSSLSRHLH